MTPTTNIDQAVMSKQRAKEALEAAGHGQAWVIYLQVANNAAKGLEEGTMFDMVSKFIQYGKISDKAMAYIGTLLKRIAQRAAFQAKMLAEKATAADCPTGRVTIKGTVLKVATYETQFGLTVKMFVKAEQGFTVFCTVPKGLTVEKGSTVEFEASVTPDTADPKHGWGKRPKAVL